MSVNDNPTSRLRAGVQQEEGTKLGAFLNYQ